MRSGRTYGAILLVAVALGGVLIGSSAAFGQAGGVVNVFGEGQGTGAGTILLTGAIGDSGKTTTVNSSGKPAQNGNYGKLSLKHGTFEVNLKSLGQEINNANPAVNSSNCSASISVSAPVQLLDGTGSYKGIGGTLTLNFTLAVILPKSTSGSTKGQCNENANPIAQESLITGSGTVSLG